MRRILNIITMVVAVGGFIPAVTFAETPTPSPSSGGNVVQITTGPNGTVTISDPLAAAIADLKTKVSQLQTDVAFYKTHSFTTQNKIDLINRVLTLKQQAILLKAQVVSLESAPAIAPPATILNPIGSTVSSGSVSLILRSIPATLNQGDTLSIGWTSTGIDSVGITLRSVPSSVYSTMTLTPTFIPASNGSFFWTIPTTLSPGDYAVQVYNAKNSASVWTSNTFHVSPKVNPTTNVNLLNPNGGANQYLFRGQSYTIQWTTSNAAEPIVINIKNDTGTYQRSLGQNANPVGSGSFVWNIGTDVPVGQYKVLLIDQSTGQILDQSEAYFTISDPVEHIDSVYPTSGPVGTVVTLQGSNFKPTNNYASFTIGNGVIPATLSSPDGKTLTFTIPTNYVISGQGMFEVDFSNDVPFTVTTPQGYLDLGSTGGVFQAGQTYKIGWNGPKLQDVALSFVQNGVTVSTVQIGTFDPAAGYFWRVPSNFSGSYTFKLKTGANDVYIANPGFTVQAATASPSPTPSYSPSSSASASSSSSPSPSKSSTSSASPSPSSSH